MHISIHIFIGNVWSDMSFVSVTSWSKVGHVRQDVHKEKYFHLSDNNHIKFKYPSQMISCLNCNNSHIATPKQDYFDMLSGVVLYLKIRCIYI